MVATNDFTHHAMKRITVYCGSRPGEREEYAEVAAGLGRLLGERGIGMVYGGGQVGLMGIAADAALEVGGEVIGVIPHALAAREVDHPGLTKLHKVDTMHERKAMMADLADAFITMPGGIGTLEELSEIWSWAYLGIHRKPVGLLNVGGYFDDLLRFIERATAEGFVRPVHREVLVVATTPGELLDALAAYEPPQLMQWIVPGER
jgi:uncharacterized protein (TIGR00730 family)